MILAATAGCALCGAHESRVTRNAIPSGPIDLQARRLLALDLMGAPEDCARFFATLFSPRQTYRTGAELAYDLAVLENTLNSRLHRAGLPGSKKYVLGALLVRVASALETSTVHDVVEQLELSSPQSLSRTIRLATGLTAREFSARYTGPERLDVFRAELVTPYLDTLRGFRPLVPQAVAA